MKRFSCLLLLSVFWTVVVAQPKLPGNFIALRTAVNLNSAGNASGLLEGSIGSGFACTLLYLEEHEQTGLDYGLSYTRRTVFIDETQALPFNQLGIQGRFRRYLSSKRNLGIQLGYVINFDVTSVQYGVSRVINGPEVGFIYGLSRIVALETNIFLPVNKFGERNWLVAMQDGTSQANSEDLYLFSWSFSVRVNLYELF